MSSSYTWMWRVNMEWVPNRADRTGAKRRFIWAAFQVWHLNAIKSIFTIPVKSHFYSLMNQIFIQKLNKMRCYAEYWHKPVVLMCRYYSRTRSPLHRPLFPRVCEESHTEPQACHAVQTPVSVWICGDSGLPCIIDHSCINPTYSTLTLSNQQVVGFLSI